ncbi:MAG: hypoxanthine phosphoribosyltransferase [Clostridia bacterium]|nr:hypoxanthine phosphoribosyltransferase [Clostridia bacterium]
MLEKVIRAISEYELLKKGQGVVVGLSGGADSVALLVSLLACSKKMELSVYAAHLNHCIRGESAKADEQFVRELCEFYGVPLFCESIDVPYLASRNGETLEQAGRNVRYDFLERARIKFGADKIAVAHHMDDQAESIMLHLTRGSGLLGLGGMQVKRGNIIRPLLFVRRAQIEAYLAENGIVYHTDETNLVADSSRNKLRLEVIPYIEKNMNSAIVPTLCRLGELLRRDEDYLDAEAKEALNRARRGAGFDRKMISALHFAIKSRVIRLALAEIGAVTDIEFIHIESIIALLDARTGARLDLPQCQAWISYDKIFFGRIKSGEEFSYPLIIGGVTRTPLGTFEAKLIDMCRIEENPYVAYLDADEAEKLELCVRTRKQGDRFFPLGAPGTKKLKDFFIDKKVPREERGMALVCAGNEVCFVPGFTISENLKVNENTKKILCIKYYDNKSITEMCKTDMKNDIQSILLDEATIQEKVKELGKQITEDYADKNVLVVCILKGSSIFFADLCRNIDCRMEMDFMSISSYGNGHKTSGVVRIAKDLDTSITGRHVLIVEDIMDSGLTLNHLTELLKSRMPASLKIVALLDKPERRQCDITPDYKGFEIPNEFAVGYGLDYAGCYRNLPYIGILKREVYGG